MIGFQKMFHLYSFKLTKYSFPGELVICSVSLYLIYPLNNGITVLDFHNKSKNPDKIAVRQILILNKAQCLSVYMV